jgi:phosphate transport system substrate-binding protein
MKKRRIQSDACHRLSAGLLVLAILLSTPLLAACSQQSSHRSIIIAGSTSVQPFAEILAEEYMRLHPEVAIDVQGGGSSAGIKAAQSGTADIGMSSRALKDEESSLWSMELARDGLAVIVHPDNPLVDLSLAQVRDIYAAPRFDWSYLGGVADKIHVFTREEGSGTRDAFSSLVMDDFEITPRALVQDSNGAVRQLVADDPAAIGYISLGLVDEQVKALQLDGVTASAAHIFDGSYRLSRPFLFVTKGTPPEEIQHFIDFTQSTEGRRILDAEGLVTKDPEDQP